MEYIIAIFTSLTVFLLILLCVTLFSRDEVKLVQNEKKAVNDFCEKILKKDPEIVANKLGIATDRYVFNCNIIGAKPKVELIILARIISFIIFIIGAVFVFFIPNIYVKILAAPIILSAAIFIFIAPTAYVSGKAKTRKNKFRSEIPRFLDLLQTALKIEIPIATAIKITAESVQGVLSEELLKALTITEVGTTNWQDALYSIAQRYEVDAFSDFVLDIVTAYQKGSDITDSVERQSRELKSTTLLKAKEDASRATNVVLLPIVIFKMLPLMAILFYPIVVQIIKAF